MQVKKTIMNEKIMIAGAGGQGNIFIGELLCLAATYEDKYTTGIPSYGPEARGGKAKFTVVISDKEIGSPIVDDLDVLIVMNGLSLDFISLVKPGGLAIINQSLAKYDKSSRPDLDIVLIPIDKILKDASIDIRMSNMALLGAYLRKRQILELKNIFEALKDKLAKKFDAEKLEKILELNKKAFMLGYNFISV